MECGAISASIAEDFRPLYYEHSSLLQAEPVSSRSKLDADAAHGRARSSVYRLHGRDPVPGHVPSPARSLGYVACDVNWVPGHASALGPPVVLVSNRLSSGYYPRGCQGETTYSYE